METITLKLGELLELEGELNGVATTEGKIICRGFLNTNLPIILKYELMELSDFLKNEKIKIGKLRDELIIKYGETDDAGQTKILTLLETKDAGGNIISTTINPKYIEFNNEYNDLMEQLKDIQYPEITKNDLKNAGNTTDNYKVLFGIVKK